MADARAAFAFTIVACCISASIVVVRYAITGDYWITAAVTCDPSTHMCFAGDGEAAPETFALLRMKAYAAPECDAWSGDCPPLSCRAGSSVCHIEYCEEDCVSAVDN